MIRLRKTAATTMPLNNPAAGLSFGTNCLLLTAYCLLLIACAGPPKVGPPDLRQEAAALNEAGYWYYRQAKWSLAQEKFRQALRLNRLIDHRPGIAANLSNLGALAQERGDYDQAQAFFQEALDLQRQLGEAAGLCEALNNLGTVCQAQGKWAEAKQLYNEAKIYADQLPPGPLVSLTLTHLGDVARQEGNFVEALNLYRQALAMDQHLRDDAGRTVRWARLGRTYLTMGDLGQAHHYLHRALIESRRLQQTQVIADVLDGMLRLALAQGDEATAVAYGHRLVELYETRGQPKEAGKVRALLKMP